MVAEENALLQTAGLSKNEAAVYLALAALGPAGASAIAEKSGVQRTLVYDTLKRLLEKGLVGQVDENKKKLFQAVPPAKFKAVVEERQKQELNTLGRLLPFLEKGYRKGERPTASVYTGVEGLKTILADEVESAPYGSAIMAYRAQPEIAALAPVFVSWWHKKRSAKHVVFKAIMDALPDSKARGRQLEGLKQTKVRYLDTTFPTPVTYHVYGNKVALMSVAKDEIIGIVIESAAFAASFRDSFEYMWKRLPA